ncbi:hypothetical protein ACHAW6_002489 [Cyclotella cf. meneghiniana]
MTEVAFLSISTLPPDVQHVMLRHLDVASMFRLLLTCRQYHTIISTDCNKIWKNHHDLRWTYGKFRPKRHRDQIITWSRENGWAAHRPAMDPQLGQVEDAGDWFHEYIYRSKVDMSVLPNLINLSSRDCWSKLVRYGEDIIDKVLAVMVGERVDDDLKSIARRGENFSDVFNKVIGITEMSEPLTIHQDLVIRSGRKFLSHVGRYIAYQEWRFLIESDVDTLIEDGAITISKFYCYQDHEYIFSQLDLLANWLQKRLKQRLGEPAQSTYPIRDILIEMGYLFGASALFGEDLGEIPFLGNSHDYYNPTNSLIHHVLKKRTGIPITLAVIYTAVVRRAFDIELDIIGLPGHIVIGVPQRISAERIFVDPFNGGRILTYDACRQLVSRYNITFREDMVNPISQKEVWQRMIRNLITVHTMQVMDDRHTSDWNVAVPLSSFLKDEMHNFSNLDELLLSRGWCYED